MANSPQHYGSNWKVGDFIVEQNLSFFQANAVKYICRCELKGEKVKDLTKAIHYLQHELEETIFESELTGPSGAFRTAYDLKTNGSQKGIQKALIDEEFSEFHEAYHFGDNSEQLKELSDLVYVCYQYAASQEWDLDEAMRRVHASNMSKLGEDGKPIYRADGKVLKGPNYKEPTLGDLINV